MKEAVLAHIRSIQANARAAVTQEMKTPMAEKKPAMVEAVASEATEEAVQTVEASGVTEIPAEAVGPIVADMAEAAVEAGMQAAETAATAEDAAEPLQEGVQLSERSLLDTMTEAARNAAKEAYVGTDEATRAVLAQVAEGVARVAEERVSWEVAVAEAESRQYSERNGHVPVDERDADYFNNIDQHEDLTVTHASNANIPEAVGDNLTWEEIESSLEKNPLVEKIRGRKVADCPDIGKKVQLTRRGLLHYNDIKNASGKAEYSEHVVRSLRVAAAVPALLQDAVEVNRSNKNATPTRPYAHVLMAVYEEAGEYYAVRMIVEHNTDTSTGELLGYDVIGQIHATNTKRIPRPSGLVSSNGAVLPRRQGDILMYRIAQLIRDVNSASGFGDTFAKRAYAKFGEKRTESKFSRNLLYSERQVVTNTAAFRRWFGNSVVVNEDGSPKAMYHGTPYGGFTVFKGWQYFTEDEAYADRYHNPSASSVRGRYSPATNPQTYAVYLSVKKPFDTRIPEIREIWENEFYGSYSRTPLSDRGLPDWTDGIDLIEFIEENDYDYDGIILDEGATGGYGEDVIDRGVSVVVRNANQIKSATDNEGTFDPSNPDIRYSERRTTAPSLRETLLAMEPTSDMTATEKELLAKYKKLVAEYRELESQVEAQRALAEKAEKKHKEQNITATRDEYLKEKNRLDVLQSKLRRMETELYHAEKRNGFGSLMNRYRLMVQAFNAGSTRAQAAERLQERLAEVTRMLKDAQETGDIMDEEALEEELTHLMDICKLRELAKELKNRGPTVGARLEPRCGVMRISAVLSASLPASGVVRGLQCTAS